MEEILNGKLHFLRITENQKLFQKSEANCCYYIFTIEALKNVFSKNEIGSYLLLVERSFTAYKKQSEKENINCKKY